MNDLEHWKPVVGYEGLYEVSSLGRVRSVEREVAFISRHGTHGKRVISSRIMSLHVDRSKDGYGRLRVGLSNRGVCKTRLVHHLVMEAFVGPRPSGYEVAHNDGNAGNNRLDNLRYATPMQNTHDKFKHGTVLRGSHVGNAKLTEQQAIQIKNSTGRYQDIADRFGIAIAQVSRIKSGKRWGHLA